ncbi:MAG: hypothetical protein BLM47_02545 [Candidatus Reconcilbacillus cellulovorans]|uniref:Gluconeogenesis factor n=1 Tax=Candidatus Reconcilbacillus cellulovorans TaxID=1906605 RepID=A0A2A6E2V5_9BACL|nr:MAG: hypothetical protein BLM47_02545 [Candidatus Reconcilbacillus cellulovorans]
METTAAAGRERSPVGPRDPKVVAIGGGTGLSVMLRGLKKLPLDLTAIVTVADDGGSSGRLRAELDMPPPGDVRNVITALATAEPLLSRLLEHRFQNGTGLAGHSLGNLILAALKEITGDFVSGVRELSRVLAVKGRVLPASGQAIVLGAELEDGRIVTGESRIPNAGGRIRRVFIEPADAAPLDEAVEAILQADAVVVGPGSLYTSIMPNLLVPRIAESIARSRAVKIFVCNVMTQPGETDGYSAGDHLKAVAAHVGGRLFDWVIVNIGDIPDDVAERYAAQGAQAVRPDVGELERLGYRVVADDLILPGTYLRHDATKLALHILRLVGRHVGPQGPVEE